MQPKQKDWFEQHGTPAERRFITKYGDRSVSANGTMVSLLYYAAFGALFFFLVGSYLFLSRTLFLRPITGTWVGVLADHSANGSNTAVLLESSIKPLQLFRPTLAGSLRMCSAHAEDEQFVIEQTRTVSADTLGVTLASSNSFKSGSIFGALRGGEFQASYDGTTRSLQGTLRRGNRSDYQQSCASVRQ